MKMLIGADLVPTKSNHEIFSNADAAALVGEELLELIRSADYRIFNLEMPLTDTVTPISKHGPPLIAPVATIAGYKALGVDLVTIANNHIMDQDVQGLSSTMRLLEENRIAFVGGGDCLEAARQPHVMVCGGKKIGVYACAEHEFSIAKEQTPGANPFDPLESLDHVATLKGQCDFVVVLYHGGKEHYRYPSPQLQKTCRKLVEKGADLVLCQHSHCIGCEETYLNGTIVYGQGNFLFDGHDNDYWRTSLLVQVNDDFSVSYIPLIKQGSGVRLATGETADQIQAQFAERSRQIQEPGFVEEQFRRFANEQTTYLLRLLGINTRGFFLRILDKATRGKYPLYLLERKLDAKRVPMLINFMECEAIREVFLTALRERQP